MHPFLLAAVLVMIAPNCSAQIVESVGNRALGMGGAFVAVADDSTATWWNPAGLATGPYSDVAVGRAVTDLKGSVPAIAATACPGLRQPFQPLDLAITA